MSIQDEASLILRLFELRRESVMRTARDWYFRDFNPESIEDFNRALWSEHSGHLRMVVTYWDMASALVLNGAISPQLFHDCTGEQIGVFAKIEPILADIRASLTPRFAANLEKLIDSMPDGRKATADTRERFKAIRAQMAAHQAATAGQKQ
jgi:hypothetical protein